MSSATSGIDAREVSLAQAVPLIATCMRIKQPVFLHGASGIGKSDLVRQIADKVGGVSVDVRMGLMQPTDLMGIPYYNKDLGVMAWAPPISLPSQAFCDLHKIVILFLDEFNTATPATMASAYQLILDRKVGEYKLPDNVVVIAAGNRQNDRGVTHKMPGPLANRLIHLNIKHDFDAWFDWAVRNDVHPDVIGYLTMHKGKLHNFDPASSSHAFPSPRSWTFVSRLVSENELSESQLTDLATGTVGEGAATEFMAHRKIANTLPAVMDILEGKVTTLKCKEMSALYSLGIAMCYELRERMPKDSKDKNYKSDMAKLQKMIDNMFTFAMNNMEIEMNVMIARTAIIAYDLPFIPGESAAFDTFYEKYGKYIIPSDK